MPSLTLTVLDQALSVIRLSPDAPVPGWVPTAGFTTVTRNDDELSIVCASAAVPSDEDLTAEAGWVALKLAGPFEFTLTGILAAVLVPLADAGVGIFAISTYDTDYVLVKATELDTAVSALGAAGHDVLV
ncbi:MAG: ACT domain-containing protein [Aquihabitans sp.]